MYQNIYCFIRVLTVLKNKKTPVKNKIRKFAGKPPKLKKKTLKLCVLSNTKSTEDVNEYFKDFDSFYIINGLKGSYTERQKKKPHSWVVYFRLT